MYYSNNVNFLSDVLATIKNGQIKDTIGDISLSGRTILKNGYVVDPKNGVEEVRDIVIQNGEVVETGVDIAVEAGDFGIKRIKLAHHFAAVTVIGGSSPLIEYPGAFSFGEIFIEIFAQNKIVIFFFFRSHHLPVRPNGGKALPIRCHAIFFCKLVLFLTLDLDIGDTCLGIPCRRFFIDGIAPAE